jgi:hypothetical protein
MVFGEAARGAAEIAAEVAPSTRRALAPSPLA